MNYLQALGYVLMAIPIAIAVSVWLGVTVYLVVASIMRAKFDDDVRRLQWAHQNGGLVNRSK